MEKCAECKEITIPFCISGTINIKTDELNTPLTLILKQQAHGAVKKITKTTSGSGVFTLNMSDLPVGFFNLFDTYITLLQKTDKTFVKFFSGSETYDCALLIPEYDLDTKTEITINE